MNSTSKRFQFQLNVTSLIIFLAILGFCAGLMMIPLSLLIGISKSGLKGIDMSSMLLSVIGTPFLAALNGAFMGLLGYPAYTWLSNRYPLTYAGRVLARDE